MEPRKTKHRCKMGFESVENSARKSPQKNFTLSSKSHKLHIAVTFSLITFFALDFLQLFQRIRNQHQILRFFKPQFAYLREKNVLVTLALFTNFTHTRTDRLKNKKRLFLKMCLRITCTFFNHQRAWENQVVKIVAP